MKGETDCHKKKLTFLLSNHASTILLHEKENVGKQCEHGSLEEKTGGGMLQISV